MNEWNICQVERRRRRRPGFGGGDYCAVDDRCWIENERKCKCFHRSINASTATCSAEATTVAGAPRRTHGRTHAHTAPIRAALSAKLNIRLRRSHSTHMSLNILGAAWNLFKEKTMKRICECIENHFWTFFPFLYLFILSAVRRWRWKMWAETLFEIVDSSYDDTNFSFRSFFRFSWRATLETTRFDMATDDRRFFFGLRNVVMTSNDSKNDVCVGPNGIANAIRKFVLLSLTFDAPVEPFRSIGAREQNRK